MRSECVRPAGLRESKKERTRAALVDAALRLAGEHGYEATTVEAIARDADVSVRTFHNYFPGKAAVFAHQAVEVIEEYGRHLADQPDTASCADAMHDAWRAMLAEHGPDLGVLRTMLQVLDSQPEIRDHLTDAAPEASIPVRAEIARRTGLDRDSSIGTWFAMELCFSAPAWVLRAAEVDVPGADDPERLLRDAFDCLSLLVAPPRPRPAAQS